MTTRTSKMSHKVGNMKNAKEITNKYDTMEDTGVSSSSCVVGVCCCC